jgi:hypothetical protein
LLRQRPKLRRQKKLFSKEKGKDLMRASNMNIDVLTWTRLIKRGIPNNCYESSVKSPESPLKNLQQHPKINELEENVAKLNVIDKGLNTLKSVIILNECVNPNNELVIENHHFEYQEQDDKFKNNLNYKGKIN